MPHPCRQPRSLIKAPEAPFPRCEAEGESGASRKEEEGNRDGSERSARTSPELGRDGRGSSVACGRTTPRPLAGDEFCTSDPDGRLGALTDQTPDDGPLRRRPLGRDQDRSRDVAVMQALGGPWCVGTLSTSSSVATARAEMPCSTTRSWMRFYTSGGIGRRDVLFSQGLKGVLQFSQNHRSGALA
jgi:hypothetical protein